MTTIVLHGFTASGVNATAMIAMLVLVVLMLVVVAAAAVALFHPDATRRKDARAVLTTLTLMALVECPQRR